VESTARRGFFLGYYIVLIEDCCSTYDPALQKHTKRLIDEYFGVVSTTREVQAAWAASSSEHVSIAKATQDG